jgi:hypothetical protein
MAERRIEDEEGSDELPTFDGQGWAAEPQARAAYQDRAAAQPETRMDEEEGETFAVEPEANREPPGTPPNTSFAAAADAPPPRPTKPRRPEDRADMNRARFEAQGYRRLKPKLSRPTPQRADFMSGITGMLRHTGLDTDTEGGRNESGGDPGNGAGLRGAAGGAGEGAVADDYIRQGFQRCLKKRARGEPVRGMPSSMRRTEATPQGRQDLVWAGEPKAMPADDAHSDDDSSSSDASDSSGL